MFMNAYGKRLILVSWGFFAAIGCALYPCPFGNTHANVGMTPQSEMTFAESDALTEAEDEPLCINEVMASNSGVTTGTKARLKNWIELYNRSEASVNAAGVYLTDDIKKPTKWRVPTNNPTLTTIPPAGFLLIWADGDATSPGLHANFKLSADANKVYLYKADGFACIDSLAFNAQNSNSAYGRYPDGASEWQFLSQATPGAANVQSYAGEVSDPVFNREHDFYDGPFELALACKTPGAVIYYTINGSEPYQYGGRVPNGKVYTSPFQISKTSCVRARAVKSGWKSSPIITQTYIFLGQVINQSNNPAGFPVRWGGIAADYKMHQSIVAPQAQEIKDALKSLPTMSLVMSLDDLFGQTQGIYANPREKTVSWERPASIEMIWPDGRKGFQANCGARIYGDVGRGQKKKSFRLLFKEMYGQKHLRYPLFGTDAAKEFDTFVLRANFNDGYPSGQSKTQYLRDEFSRRLQLALGQPSAHGQFVHLYVNGLYWGLYNPVERPDASFAAAYFGGKKKDWDAFNSGLPTGGGADGYYNAMLNAARRSASTDEGYQRLQGNNPDGAPNPNYRNYLDIDNYIDYLIVNFFIGNTDWPHKNWYAAVNRLDSTGFKCFCWDAEWAMDLALPEWGISSNLTSNVVGATAGIAEPYGRLRQNPEFRLRFADHIYRAFFNGGPLYVDTGKPGWDPLHPERNRPAALYAELASLIEKAMFAENARWGDVGGKCTVAQWLVERDYLLNEYLAQRSSLMLDQFRSAGLYPRVDAPVIQINGASRHGGRVATGAKLSMTGSTVWYTLDGSDPRQSTRRAQPNSYTTLLPETAPKRVLVPTGPVADAWLGGKQFDDYAWTSVTTGPGGIGYERDTGYEKYLSIDLGGQMYNKQTTCYIRIPFIVPNVIYPTLLLKLRYDDGFIAYLNGTEVARRNFIGEPQWNSSASTDHPDAEAVVQTIIDISDHAHLLAPGDNLLAIQGLNIKTDSTDLLISVELSASKETPAGVAAAEASASALPYSVPITLSKSSIVKARAFGDRTWSALNEAVFTVGPVAEGLRVSELMYHPASTGNSNDRDTEYIELTNTAGRTINLNLVRFIKGIKFTFPSFELSPGGYCLVVKNRSAFQAKYGATLPVVGEYAGNLSKKGEQIALADALGAIIQSFTYDGAWFKKADGGGYSLAIKDLKNADADRLNDPDAWQAAHPSPGHAKR
jgi:hypothetical protein